MATLRLESVLGRGSYGVVHRATLQKTPVAVKTMPLAETKAVANELNKMRLAANHTNVVALLADFVHDDTAYLVLELCQLGSVADLIAHDGRPGLDEHVARAVCADAAAGLAHLHDACAIAHRDVKAGNLLVCADGTTKLGDLGIAARLGSHDSGTVVGSPLWMAPEMIDRGVFDASVDVWALGITLLEMLEGQPPLADSKPTVSAMFNIVSNPAPTLREPSKWSDECARFADACLRKEPAERLPAHQLARAPWCATASREALLMRYRDGPTRHAAAAAASGSAHHDEVLVAMAADILPSLLAEPPLAPSLRVRRVVGCPSTPPLAPRLSSDERSSGTAEATIRLEATARFGEESLPSLSRRQSGPSPVTSSASLASTLRLEPDESSPSHDPESSSTLRVQPPEGAPSSPQQSRCEPPTLPLLSPRAAGTFSSLAHPLRGGRHVAVTRVDPSTITPHHASAFNEEPLAFVEAALAGGKRPADVARFVIASASVSKERLGALFATGAEAAGLLATALYEQLDLGRFDVDHALRIALALSLLPQGRAEIGEALRTILPAFGAAYAASSGDVAGGRAATHGTELARDADDLALLSLLLLRVGAGTPASEKLSLPAFLRAAHDIEPRVELPKKRLATLYDKVTRRPFRPCVPVAAAEDKEGQPVEALPPRPTHVGWLLKEPRSDHSGWHRRWCRVGEGELQVFKSAESTQPLRAVQLRSMRVRPVATGARKLHKHTQALFELHPAGAPTTNVQAFEQGLHSRYTFAAESPDERAVWIEAMRAYTGEEARARPMGAGAGVAAGQLTGAADTRLLAAEATELFRQSIVSRHGGARLGRPWLGSVRVSEANSRRREREGIGSLPSLGEGAKRATRVSAGVSRAAVSRSPGGVGGSDGGLRRSVGLESLDGLRLFFEGFFRR